MKVSIVIPCYNVGKSINTLIKDIYATKIKFHKIYIIDDFCPMHTGRLVKQKSDIINIIYHKKNQGVGGAVITGYQEALKDGSDIVIKIDGDGQMRPKLIPLIIEPLLNKQADYTKGNRFYNIDHALSMPVIRIIGNATLSFITKFSSGYWKIFDPTNGYTAIHKEALSRLTFDKINKRFFFESDMLFRLNIINAVVEDIPMEACYKGERSNLKIQKIIIPFLCNNFKNFLKRIFYSYFLRDFTAASVELILGLILLVNGIFFGAYSYLSFSSINKITPPGTVMISAIQIILGVQFLLAFLSYDISSSPKKTLQR